MNKRILWIDDDYYAIQGLFRPLQRDGYELEVAVSANDGYQKAQNWQRYDLMVIDLILPISLDESAPEIVKNWDNQAEHGYVGIGLAKWLLNEIKPDCPVVILSVVPDPIETFNLGSLGLAGYIRKSGLLPTELKEELRKIIDNNN